MFFKIHKFVSWTNGLLIALLYLYLHIVNFLLTPYMLIGLLQVPIPGIDVSYCPDLYISVICHTPVVCSATNQVGYLKIWCVAGCQK